MVVGHSEEAGEVVTGVTGVNAATVAALDDGTENGCFSSRLLEALQRRDDDDGLAGVLPVNGSAGMAEKQ